MKRIEQLALIVLRGKLSENEESENAIPRGHPETNTRRTDLSFILSSLFMPWNHLSSLFLAEGATLVTYKEFCWGVWVKCEPTLPPYVRFYANNICQMRITRIEVRADIAARADTRKAARLAVDDWRDETTDMADNDGKAEIDPTNVGLAEFGVQTEMFLADSVRKTCRKWAIDDFTKCSDNNFITSLIMNIGAESTTHMKESLTICRCQVDELDCPDIGDIDYVSEDIVSSWQKIICRGGQPTEIDTDIDINYDHHKSNLSSHPDSLTRILEPIIGEIEMSEEHLTKVESSRLGDNPQAIILCDIIQDRLPLNHLQRVVIEEVLNHATCNEGNQYHLRSDQLLLYVKEEGGVGKSRIVKAIYLGFSFLKR